MTRGLALLARQSGEGLAILYLGLVAWGVGWVAWNIDWNAGWRLLFAVYVAWLDFETWSHAEFVLTNGGFLAAVIIYLLLPRK